MVWRGAVFKNGEKCFFGERVSRKIMGILMVVWKELSSVESVEKKV